MANFAPCRCGTMIYNPPLTGYSEPDGGGGTNWEVVPNTFCADCGEPLNWYHVPAPDELVWDLAAVEVKNESLN